MTTSMTRFEPAESRVRLTVDTTVYPREAVLGAAYTFTDRCFVLLDSPGPEQLQIELRGRETLDQPALQVLVGEFGNELLAQATRQVIGQQNRSLIEAIVSRAVGAAKGPGASAEIDLSELEDLELDDEPFDDPLGIAVSWEEKYGKKKDDA